LHANLQPARPVGRGLRAERGAEHGAKVGVTPLGSAGLRTTWLLPCVVDWHAP